MLTVRQEWLDRLITIVGNVIDNLSEGKLKEQLPLDFHAERAAFAPLEAFGRCMLGLAPWLEADSATLEIRERVLQANWREKVLLCMDKATDPASPDFMNFHAGHQPLVDAAFLAHAILRAPKALGASMPEKTRRQLAAALRSSRIISPGSTNWLFFSAMVEAGLFMLGEEYDMLRVLYALRSFRSWYKGDGMYGDGPFFHFDYYNSFVIHPMYVDLVKLLADEHHEIRAMRTEVNARAARYASILERMIGPEGSYPVVGRSMWSLILPGAISVYNLIVARTFIVSSIPGELLEASQIDGCSDVRYYLSIVLPLSGAIIAVEALFYAVGHWNAYFNAMIYLSKRSLYPLTLYLREILMASNIDPSTVTDPELQARLIDMVGIIKYALIVVAVVPVLLFYPFVQKYFVKGVMIGSVKG